MFHTLAFETWERQRPAPAWTIGSESDQSDAYTSEAKQKEVSHFSIWQMLIFFCRTRFWQNKGFSKKFNKTEQESHCKGFQFVCRKCQKIFYIVESNTSFHNTSWNWTSLVDYLLLQDWWGSYWKKCKWNACLAKIILAEEIHEQSQRHFVPENAKKCFKSASRRSAKKCLKYWSIEESEEHCKQSGQGRWQQQTVYQQEGSTLYQRMPTAISRQFQSASRGTATASRGTARKCWSIEETEGYQKKSAAIEIIGQGPPCAMRGAWNVENIISGQSQWHTRSLECREHHQWSNTYCCKVQTSGELHWGRDKEHQHISW